MLQMVRRLVWRASKHLLNLSAIASVMLGNDGSFTV